jgi:hypothetical protein
VPVADSQLLHPHYLRRRRTDVACFTFEEDPDLSSHTFPMYNSSL